MNEKLNHAIESTEMMKRIGKKQVYYSIGYRPIGSFTFTSANEMVKELGYEGFFFKLTNATDMVTELESHYCGYEYCVFRCEEL